MFFGYDRFYLPFHMLSLWSRRISSSGMQQKCLQFWHDDKHFFRAWMLSFQHKTAYKHRTHHSIKYEGAMQQNLILQNKIQNPECHPVFILKRYPSFLYHKKMLPSLRLQRNQSFLKVQCQHKFYQWKHAPHINF